MADYVIGDVQGCFDPLRRLLDKLNYDDAADQLWFVGDLVNRGPDSLAVLRLIHALKKPAKITLGNHDLHFLGALFTDKPWSGKDDTLTDLLRADDAQTLGHWLRKQPVMISAPEHSIVMSHAGIPPFWDISEALTYAEELESALCSENFYAVLNHMYGNHPDRWSADLAGIERLRFIINAFTRMRLCYADGRLDLAFKGRLEDAPADCYPWFDWPGRKSLSADLVFGHWAALNGRCNQPGIYAIDTGCVWGGELTALRLDDKKQFAVSCV